jgi:hypothetical protein
MMIILPRHARDKQREALQRTDTFLQAHRYRITGDNTSLTKARQQLDKIMELHGQASGVFSAGECICGKHPDAGTETCAVVETMESLGQLFTVTVRETPSFEPFKYSKNESFYQDRLGTNTGKIQKRRGVLRRVRRRTWISWSGKRKSQKGGLFWSVVKF